MPRSVRHVAMMGIDGASVREDDVTERPSSLISGPTVREVVLLETF